MIPAERFWEKVTAAEGDQCQLWIARRDAHGYGKFRLNGRMVLAHRLAWELANGPVPPETPHVLHNCPGGDNPACVRHLWLGTHADNMADMVAKGRSNRGERRPAAKLTEENVVEIRRLHSEEGFGYCRLSRRFGVGVRTIRNIFSGRTWSWLEQTI